jgi:hypothetical protein
VLAVVSSAGLSSPGEEGSGDFSELAGAASALESFSISPRSSTMALFKSFSEKVIGIGKSDLGDFV